MRFACAARINGFAHCVTAAYGNLSLRCGPGVDQAVARRQALCRDLALPFANLTLPQQVHGADVLRVQAGDLGRGSRNHYHAVPFVDGLLCDLPGVPLMVLSADCPLLLVVDPVRRAFGVAHASWRGTLAGIGARLVERMVAEFGSDPHQIVAGISPSARPCCYEVGWEVLRIARTRMPQADAVFERRGGKLFFDMPAALRRQLIGAGIPETSVETAPSCTICDRRWFSWRRQGRAAGRFALVAGFVG